MNKRRLKKKCLYGYRNPQQIAKDKLFQISYFCDYKYIDQSQILAVDHRRHQQSLVQKQAKIQRFGQVILKEKREININFSKYKDVVALEAKAQNVHRSPMLISNVQNGIYNVLESNKVFVGFNLKGKKYREDNKPYPGCDIKKRLETMPQSPKLESIAYRSSLKTQKCEDRWHNSFITQQQRFYRVPNSLNKINANPSKVELKQKQRYERLVKTLNCTFNRNL